MDKKHLFLRHLQCFDLPSETAARFSEIHQGLKEAYQRDRGEIRKWWASGRAGEIPAKRWKDSEQYASLVSALEFLPFIRLEYLQSLKRSGHEMDEVNSSGWEEVVRDMTGGELTFPQEVPAMSSDERKAAICGLNIGSIKPRPKGYGSVRTGLDYICGYIQRIDRALGEDTLSAIIKYKILNPI